MTTLDLVTSLNLADLLKQNKKTLPKNLDYVEGYYDGAMDIYNAIIKHLGEKNS